MNRDQNNVQHYDDKINLIELIMVLWKRKNIIITLTIVVAILTGMFSIFVLSPVYDTKLNIVISMPETYSTKYGEYTLPITTNQQYINLIKSNNVLINTINDMGYDTEKVNLESLQKRIIVTENDINDENKNSFEVTVSSNNPEESLKLAQTLYSNYLDFMDAMTKERAINYYYNNFSVEIGLLENSLNSAKETLIKNEELLAQTPKKIEAGKANLEIQTQLNSTSDYIVPVDTVNPNYIKIENDIIENKQSINNIENVIRMNKKYLEELDDEKSSIYNYYRTGQTEKLNSSVIGLVETYLYLPSSPVAPTQKTSPSNALNIVMGAVIGGMLGIIVSLAKEYWVKESKN